MPFTKQSRMPLILAAIVAIIIVAGLNLNKDKSNQSSSSSLISQDIATDLVGKELLRTNSEIQKILKTMPRATVVMDEFNLYFQLSSDFSSIKTRRAAESRLLEIWEKEPDNLVWIDLAIVKYNHIISKEDHKKLLAVAVGNDTSAVADFVYWRKNVLRKPDAEERLLRAEEQQENLSPKQRIWLQNRLAINERVYGRMEAAVTRLLATLPMAMEVGGLPLASYWWHELSSNYMLLGQQDNALYSITASLQYARMIPAVKQELRARLKMGLIHASRGETNTAYDTINSCYATARDSNLTRNARKALVQLSLLARIEGHVRRELWLMASSAEMAKADADTYFAIGASAAAGNAYRRLGVLDSASIWLEQATELREAWSFEGNKVDISEAWILYYQQIGDYAKVDSMLNMTTEGELQERQFNRQASYVILLIKQGLESGRADMAYRGLKWASTISTVGDGPNTGFSPSLEIALVSARFLAHQGEFQQAQQQLNTAKEFLAGTPNAENELEYEHCRGEIASLSGDYIGANRHFTKSWQLAQQISDPSLQNRIMVGLGENYLNQKQFEKAQSLFSKIRKSPEYWPRLNATLYLGITAAEQGNHQLALQYYSATDSLLGSTPPTKLKAKLILKKSVSLIATGHPEKAYDLLMGMHTLSFQSCNEEAMRSFHLEQQRDRAEALIGLLHDHPHVAGNTPPVLAALVEAEGARWRPGKDDPLPNAENLVQLIQEHNGPILAFFVGKKRTFCWQGDSSGWTMRDLGSTSQLQTLMTDVVTDMEYPGRAVDATVAGELSQKLLGNIKQHWPAGQPLSIITDGFLTNVPFVAFVDEHGPIVHLTALSANLNNQQAMNREKPLTLLALGVNDSNDDQSSNNAASKLRYAEEEARTIAAMWPQQDVTLLLGKDAHWNAILDQDLSNFSAIHLATHAQVTQGLPGSTTLRFAEGETSTPVTIYEVRDLDLNADLVFLTCCETGRLFADTGSGLNSFARAFLQAGASSVLAPIILVEDEASKYLAQRFYHYWLQGKSRAASLMAAQADTRNARESWRHPYYWAFFRLYMLPTKPMAQTTKTRVQ